MAENTYGSDSERLFHLDMFSLAFIHNKLLRTPQTKEVIVFRDRNYESFGTMGDFWHRESRTIIEFKITAMNFQQSQMDSYLAEQNSRIKNKFLKIKLCSWSNSAIKYLLVQQELARYGINFLVILGFEAKLSKQQENKLTELGLQWICQKGAEFFINGCTGLSCWKPEQRVGIDGILV
ncbi:hypothetical protein [Vibrio sp. FF145]|uniref:hypothetical protein n=1 Tax=Vibrio sp. FF145 TaxID=3230013 RepID=UPI00352CE9D4